MAPITVYMHARRDRDHPCDEVRGHGWTTRIDPQTDLRSTSRRALRRAASDWPSTRLIFITCTGVYFSLCIYSGGNAKGRNSADPIGVGVETMASLVSAGKVKYLGLSEVSASTLHWKIVDGSKGTEEKGETAGRSGWLGCSRKGSTSFRFRGRGKSRHAVCSSSAESSGWADSSHSTSLRT
jgi:hypothetical protein